jgi:nucleoid-associated protein YgaU
MPLEHLTITPEGGAPIKALYNPERYTASKSVQYAEVAIPGLDAPVVQFVRGQSEKITMELFFDTTDHGTVEDVRDVRDETAKVYKLLRVQSDTHAPPRCILLWGDGGKLFAFGTRTSPWCVLESVSEEFTLFSPSGVPLRAKLNVSFRDAWTIEEQLRETPRHTSDRTTFTRVKARETLSHVAWRQYGDPDEWRPLAEANGIENPRLVAEGTMLRVPRNVPEERP